MSFSCLETAIVGQPSKMRRILGDRLNDERTPMHLFFGVKLSQEVTFDSALGLESKSIMENVCWGPRTSTYRIPKWII